MTGATTISSDCVYHNDTKVDCFDDDYDKNNRDCDINVAVCFNIDDNTDSNCKDNDDLNIDVDVAKCDDTNDGDGNHCEFTARFIY